MLDLEIGASMFGDVCRALWNDIVCPEDQLHLMHGAHVERVFNARGKRVAKLMTYLAKYVSKVSDETPVNLDTGECLDVGRSWGFWGHLPIDSISGSLDLVDLVTLLRRLRRWSDNPFAKRLNVEWLGFSLYGDGFSMLQLLRGLPSVSLCEGQRQGA